MASSVTRKELVSSLKKKMEESATRIECLSDWLFDHTDGPSSEYEEKLAEYHSENRKYNLMEMRLNRETPQDIEDVRRRNAMDNYERNHSINY